MLPNITVSHFENLFGKVRSGENSAISLAEAPGRVNLIGEHTDYNCLPVFPMALQRRFRMLFRPRCDEMVRVATVDGYSERSFTVAGEIVMTVSSVWKLLGQG